MVKLRRQRRISGRTDLGVAAPGSSTGAGRLVKRLDTLTMSHPDNKSTEMSSAPVFSVHVPPGGARRSPKGAPVRHDATLGEVRLTVNGGREHGAQHVV